MQKTLETKALYLNEKDKNDPRVWTLIPFGCFGFLGMWWGGKKRIQCFL